MSTLLIRGLINTLNTKILTNGLGHKREVTMKHSQPQFTTIESSSDVQTFRDATGDVLEIGQTVMQGIVNDTPTGRRRYADEIAAYSAFLTMELGYEVEIKPVNAKALKPVKTKPI